MSHTVHEVAKLSGVTIKTLHHYHKIGLLVPEWVGANGYRYYSDEDLETLQQILVYRELDFPLRTIRALLEDGPSRMQGLHAQKGLLKARHDRLASILGTLEETILHAEKGHVMDKEKIFAGLNKQGWEAALSEQNDYLKAEYNYDMLAEGEIEPDRLNAQSDQVTRFLTFMADALREGIPAHGEAVTTALEKHIAYVNEAIYPTTAQSFLEEAEFFLGDDFHRNMYETIQTGLSYYIFAAAKMHAQRG